MPRTQKNVEGKDVRVDTPDYGCKTVEHGKPASKTTKTPAKGDDDKGEA